MEHNLIHCVSASVKNGLNKSGTQRYKCPDCGKNWTPRAKPIGRKPIGNRTMTDAERQRKHRQQGTKQ